MLITDGIHVTSTRDLKELKLFVLDAHWAHSRLHKLGKHAHADVRGDLADVINGGALYVSSRTLAAMAFWHREKAKFWLKAYEEEGFLREKVWLIDINERLLMMTVESEEYGVFEVSLDQAE